MNVNQASLFMIATQLMMFSGAWGLAAWLLPDMRRAALHFMVFCIAGFAALVLFALRGFVPLELTDVPAQIALLITFISLWRAVDVLRGSTTNDREQTVLLVGVSVILIAMLFDPSLRIARVVVINVASVWIILRLLGSMRLSLRESKHDRLVLPITLVGSLLALAIVVRSAFVLMTNPEQLSISSAAEGSLPLLWAAMMSTTMANLSFGYVVVAGLVGQLHAIARNDAMTGLFNRRAFNEVLAKEWSRKERQKEGYALVVFDADHFKKVNDTYGHPTGDEVLVQIARITAAHARPSDCVARIGGEEFAMLLPATHSVGAFQMGDRLREAMAAATWPQGMKVTISVGVAVAEGHDATPSDVLARADRALYQAKNSGRNRTVAVRSDFGETRVENETA